MLLDFTIIVFGKRQNNDAVWLFISSTRSTFVVSSYQNGLLLRFYLGTLSVHVIKWEYATRDVARSAVLVARNRIVSSTVLINISTSTSTGSIH